MGLAEGQAQLDVQGDRPPAEFPRPAVLAQQGVVEADVVARGGLPDLVAGGTKQSQCTWPTATEGPSPADS